MTGRPDDPDREPLFFAAPAELREWLSLRHATARELWVGMYRKAAGAPTLTWQEIVDEVLCFGWIDGRLQPIDARRYAIRITPRTSSSTWSTVNVNHIERLRNEGRMTPAGEAAFARRRADRSGTYSYENREKSRLSDTDASTFRENEEAWAFFESQAPSFRKTAIHWVVSAKRPETRARRLAMLIDESAAGRWPKQFLRRAPSAG